MRRFHKLSFILGCHQPARSKLAHSYPMPLVMGTLLTKETVALKTTMQEFGPALRVHPESAPELLWSAVVIQSVRPILHLSQYGETPGYGRQLAFQ